jgi:hypothetical protein
MPRLHILFLAAFGGAAPLLATDLTVVVAFDHPYSDRSFQQMKRETEDIVRGSGLRLEWRSRGDAAGASFANLVSLRFTGTCILDARSGRGKERGPLAFTYDSDGQILPFGEVACDRVASSLSPAMWGDDFVRSDYLLGRALGRVVAHELVHIITKSSSHGDEGVAQAALSGSQLIGAPLRLSPNDLERLRRGLTGR